MKTKYFKPETQLLDIDLAEHLQATVDATGATQLPDSSGTAKGTSDWELEEDEVEDDWW